MPTNKELSFIVQGPIGEQTATCLRSIRTYYPGAEIVLSTWVDEERTAELSFDKLVVNDDPGCIYNSKGRPVNLNRMAVTTYQGLKVASRPYAVKMRSDCFLRSGSHLLRVIENVQNSAMAKNQPMPILVSRMFSRDASRSSMLFHVSDVYQASTRNQLELYWRHQFTSEDLGSKISQKSHLSRWFPESQNYLVPEQALCLRYLETMGISAPDYNNRLRIPSYKMYSVHERYVRSLFVILDEASLGLACPRHFYDSRRRPDTCFSGDGVKYHHGEWSSLRRWLSYALHIYQINIGQVVRLIKRRLDET